MMKVNLKIKKIAATIVLGVPLLTGCACIQHKPDCNQILKEIKVMGDTMILNYGDYDVMLPPMTYCPGDEIRYVFAVPRDNMVGTNELDNAIKLIEFKTEDKLEQHTVKKNFMEMVTGPFEFRFLPVWSDKEIAYSQSKGFLLVNIPERKVEIHTISPGIYTGEIEKLAILDANSRTFVIEIDKPYAKVQGFKKVLQVIRFENNTFNILAEHMAGIKTLAYSEPWFVYQKKIFTYNDSLTKFEVFDQNFKPDTHPLAETFNRNSHNFRCLKEIIFHPSLPFALMVEQGKPPTKEKLAAADSLPDPEDEKARDIIYGEFYRQTLFLFRWNEPDEKKQLIPLFSIAGSIWKSYNPVNDCSQLTLSPDGKWLVFRDGSMRGDDLHSSDNPIFVAVPIDEKNPLYLGKPLKLGHGMREGNYGPTGTAWTTNPTAFVMCDGLLIYRWNLDNYEQLSKHKVNVPPGSPDPFDKSGR
jgi:hypothetical protein